MNRLYFTLITLLLLALTPVHAAPVSVTECPGSIGSGTYILQEDISGGGNVPCFNIIASKVTIELNGHSITCTSDCGAAAINTSISDHQNITVLGPGKIEGFTWGVLYQGVTKGSISKIFSNNNLTGIDLLGCKKTTVTENVVLGGTIGIGLSPIIDPAITSEGNLVADNEVIGNNQGIVLADTEDTLVEHNNATHNAVGIGVQHSVVPSTPNEVTENIAVGNSLTDIAETGGLMGSPFGTYADNFCEIGNGCPNFPDFKISHF